MYRYFLWGKRTGENIVQPFAVFKVSVRSSAVSILERLLSDSSQQNLWILLATRLSNAIYYLILPPIWDVQGHLNLFWVSEYNVIMREIPVGEMPAWENNYPVFNIF